jgi:hypothetical protein
MLESKLQTKLIKELRTRGMFVRKIESPGYAGMPDLFIAYGGRSLWLELKTDTGRLSELQKVTIEDMRQQGCEVAVAYGLEQARHEVYTLFGTL